MQKAPARPTPTKEIEMAVVAALAAWVLFLWRVFRLIAEGCAAFPLLTRGLVALCTQHDEGRQFGHEL